ncbi:hypothetical protein RHGRI_025699 [Rhododendron griersonianum]|uniref:SAP domain-containing protein n=1 Tax=Rhododendron griersonianum TaxID=479676 RepID=A0AAV6IQQ0_9ERIC|nr:hypothetical protein RHGRI_025699 [Rhododendron griersonianum]
MATENLRHRIGDDSTIIDPNENNHDIYKDYDEDNDNEDEYEDYIEETSMRGRMLRWRAAIARHGFSSLTVAVLPASLHLVDVFFLRSAERASARPSWFLTPWIMDAHFVLSSLVMGLSSWFAWAENGPPPKPTLFASRLLGFTALSLAWDPIVFGWGAVHLGPHVRLPLILLCFLVELCLVDEKMLETAEKFGLMENRDDKDLYLSHSKKELQELCKRYGLSPYMTKPNLADALSSYLKGKNASPIFQAESSSVRSASLISPLECGSKSYKMVHAPKGLDIFTNYIMVFVIASGSRIDRDLEYPLYEVGENFRLPCKKRGTLVSRNELGCNEINFYREKSPKISFCNHSFSVPREVGESNAPLILHTNLDHGACLAENASPSSTKSPESIPSFEFYIRSEEGVNLIVDMNSSLSDWSKRLESELCCCHNLVDNKFGSLRKELQLLGKSNTAIKGSFLQNTDAKHEMKNGCAHSTEKGCETVVIDEENLHLLFSSPKSVVGNHVTSGAESDPTDRETIPVESSAKSSTNSLINSMPCGSKISLEHQNLEVGHKNCKELNGKSTCTDMGPSLVYPGSLSTGSVETQSPEEVSHKDDSCSPCRNNNLLDVVDLTLDVETRDDEMQSPEVVSHKDDSCSPCRNNDLLDVVDLTLDVETRDDEMQSPEVVSHKDDSCCPCRNNNLLDVVDLTLDVETRDDELANSSTCQDYVSACVDEREKSEVTDGVQTSE